MERGFAPDSGGVGIGVVLEQVDDDVHATHEAGDVKRCQAAFGCGTYAFLETNIYYRFFYWIASKNVEQNPGKLNK